MYNSMYRCGETSSAAGNTALVFTTVCTGVGKQPEAGNTALVCTTACTGVGKQPEWQVTLNVYDSMYRCGETANVRYHYTCMTVCTGVGKQPNVG